MKLNEIDLDFTSNHVETKLTQIKKDLETGSIDKNQAINTANKLIKQIKFEIELSDLTEHEKSQYIHLILVIKLFVKHIVSN